MNWKTAFAPALLCFLELQLGRALASARVLGRKESSVKSSFLSVTGFVANSRELGNKSFYLFVILCIHFQFSWTSRKFQELDLHLGFLALFIVLYWIFLIFCVMRCSILDQCFLDCLMSQKSEMSWRFFSTLVYGTNVEPVLIQLKRIQSHHRQNE